MTGSSRRDVSRVAAAADDTSRTAMVTARGCAWCPNAIPAGKRSDTRFCSKSCRQAAHRFASAGYGLVPPRDAGRPLALAYADPPYPGKARRYYAGHPDYAGEVDHEELVARLVAEFPMGWALSTDSDHLQEVLSYCPPGVRIASWTRGERPTKSYSPLSAWEPVVYSGGRAVLSDVDARRVDALVYTARPRLTDQRRVVGAKPAAFCFWLFSLLGAAPGDTFTDLFAGSGGVARAWSLFEARHGQREFDLEAVALDVERDACPGDRIGREWPREVSLESAATGRGAA